MLKPVGFGTGCMQCAFFDIRVFYPNAQSNRSAQLSTAYNKHQSEKRRIYGHRFRDIEHGSFSPLVFSSTEGIWAKKPRLCSRGYIITRVCQEGHPVLQSD